MIEISAYDLASRVLRMLGEPPELEGATKYDDESFSPRAAVMELLPQVAERVVRDVDRNLINEWDRASVLVQWKTPNRAVVTLPPDFCRFISLRMADWKRGVHCAVSYNTPQWSILFSDNRNPRFVRPAVSLVPGARGLEIEVIGSFSSQTKLDEFYYLPLPYNPNTQKYRFPQGVEHLVVAAAAARFEEFRKNM